MPDIPNRDELEKKLANAVSKSMAGLPNKFIKEFEKYGFDPYHPEIVMLFNRMAEDQQDIFRKMLTDFTATRAQAMASGLTIQAGIDWDLINQAAANWARHYSTILAGTIGDTSRDRVANSIRESIADYFESGITRGELRKKLNADPELAHLFTEDVKDKLGRVFGPRRAEMIARTEVTRAAVEGERFVIDDLVEKGANLVEVWHTRNDEIVCPICGPRNGEVINNPNPKKNGGTWNRDQGPPAHPNCRCWIGFRKPGTQRQPKAPTIPGESLIPKEPEILRIGNPMPKGENLGQAARDRLADVKSQHKKAIEKVNLKSDRLNAQKDDFILKYSQARNDYYNYLDELGGLENLDKADQTYQILSDQFDFYKAEIERLTEELAGLGGERDLINARMQQILENTLNVENPGTVDFGMTSTWNSSKYEGLKNSTDYGIERFGKMVDADLIPDVEVKFRIERGSRAYYMHGTDPEIYLSKWDDGYTAIHELGHFVEHHSDEVTDLIERFYNYRTEGEDLQKLRDVTGMGYRASEVTKVDKFVDAYMGKYYGRKGSSEILSMGLELMARDPIAFAEADPEMFDFIFNLVRGNLQ